jgi:hypothetical protein
MNLQEDWAVRNVNAVHDHMINDPKSFQNHVHGTFSFKFQKRKNNDRSNNDRSNNDRSNNDRSNNHHSRRNNINTINSHYNLQSSIGRH